MPITKYSYTISVDIPGGVWNSGASARLETLAATQITTSLASIQVLNDKLTLTFADALTPAEKTILDGGQAAPVGGILAKAVETVAIFVDGTLKTDNSRVVIPVNGILFKTVTLQVVDGLNQAVTAAGETVSIDPSAVCAINKLDGSLDIDGEFEFILGPDVRRGNVTLNIAVQGFPGRVLGVSFR